MAVCLVGAARAFELTGESLNKYLLEANNHTDVFLHAPFDKDSHKFTLLKGAPRFVKALIFVPQRLPEIQIQREVLTGANSPNGIQVRRRKLTWKSLVCFCNIEEYLFNVLRDGNLPRLAGSTLPSWTLIFERYVVRLFLKNTTTKTCVTIRLDYVCSEDRHRFRFNP